LTDHTLTEAEAKLHVSRWLYRGKQMVIPWPNGTRNHTIPLAEIVEWLLITSGLKAA
jgi:hypothetical protein